MAFDISSRFRTGLPAPAAPWNGFPAYNFVGGHNDAASVPIDAFVEASERVLRREGQTLATYGLDSGPQGYAPLREFIAGALNARAGMAETTDNILVVSGSLQALDLVNDVFLEPGDTVIAEEASYQGTLTRFERLGVRCLGAPLGEEGIRMDTLANMLADLKSDGVTPKFIYTIPTVQNPTGTVMPEGRRLELLKLAGAYDTAIFEDDCYADLTFDGTRPRAIRALDTENRVVYCGSFSKTIAPALRVGFVAADWDVMSRLLAVKRDAGSGALEQMVLAEYCSAHFDSHVSKLQGVLHEKCRAIMEALDAEFGTSAEYREPKGGIFIWVTLPDGVDTMKLYEAAAADGVALNPGAEWSVEPASGRHSMRLCFGNPTLDEIREGVAKLADICHREFGVPVRSANVAR
ncbi:MAG: PLP-dependent aminotransferase family protein [Alphaproteobacteria bacterium]|nr:PLP-dependent aminotransferase family protein [Alphaproteobacteria bacterium]